MDSSASSSSLYCENIQVNVFVGYDSREDIAYQVAKYSVRKHSPTSNVYPIVMDSLRADGIYTRGKDLLASTAFSTTRYLTPLMAGYKDIALYIDCDVLVTQDVNNILSWDYLNPKIPVWVVQHNFTPKSQTKMDGRRQITYPRKGWMSVALFNCAHTACKALTPEVINSSPIQFLNEMQWCDGYEIGELDRRWNHLVRHHHAPEEDARTLIAPTDKTPAIIHWTLGGQWLGDQPEQDYDALWRTYRDEWERVKAMRAGMEVTYEIMMEEKS